MHEREDDMERLISLFKEAGWDQWSPSQAQPPLQREHDEPLYFQELLEYLREQRAVNADDDEAETLIGAGA
jgi:hypothetical protein